LLTNINTPAEAPGGTEMSETIDAVEAVAKAFYELQDDARGWEREPEVLKEPFREFARAAIAMLHQAEEHPQTATGSYL
jgi:hypothetical protein